MSVEGAELVKGEVDPWGQQIVYRLINRKIFTVGSPGPDGDLLSSGAIVLRGTLEEPAQADNQESWLAQRRRTALDWGRRATTVTPQIANSETRRDTLTGIVAMHRS